MQPSHNPVSRRSERVLPLLALTLTALAAQSVAFAQEAPSSPAAFLKWSMNKYAEMPTFQAECQWSVAYPGAPIGNSSRRTIHYAKPNQFKIVSGGPGGNLTQVSVSDGKKLVEYATGLSLPAQSYAAPASLADGNTMMLGHPMFCGSLLYKFFGGAEKYASLVNGTKQPVSFGPAVTLEGQTCKTITFWAQGATYGKTEIAIGEKDGLVYRIRYGSEPLMEQTRKLMKSPEFLAQIKKASGGLDAKQLKAAMTSAPTSSQTTETYTKLAVGQPIEPTVFTAKAPEGQQEQEMGGGSETKPPVPLGSPAPAFTVTSVEGVKKSLTDFKGRVVLIDFWATWCPPCRKGLPETQKFYAEYGKKGLAVLTISDEAKPTVLAFLKQYKYTFPAYLDKGSATNKAYNISAIPTVAIIDKSGNLSAYMVGLSPRGDILAALKKAGLETK